MISSSRIWALAVTGILCLLAPAAASAATRYAAPGGAGTACSQSAPCDIQTAVEDPAVVNGDEVILAPGTYSTGNNPLVASDAIDLHGAAGSPRPLIDSAAGFAVVIGAFGSIQDVELHAAAPGIGLIVARGATATRVVSIAGANGAIGCYLAPDGPAPPLIRESACISNGSGGIALQSSAGVSAGTAALARAQDVTAVATGPSSGGIKAASSGSGGNVTLQAANTIASGSAADAIAEGGSGSTAFAQLTYSDFDSQQELANAAVTDPGYDSNVTGPALLVNPAAGDVHQRPGSWTIDRGGAAGGADIDGDARPQGAAPDIGADELVVTAKKQKCLGAAVTIAASGAGIVVGTPGRDVIIGTPGRDRIDSGGGKDLICSLGGRDAIRAGAGADRVRAAGAGDRLFGEAGRDRLLGGGGRDRIKGGRGRDLVAGGGGVDRCPGSRRDRTRSCE